MDCAALLAELLDRFLLLLDGQRRVTGSSVRKQHSGATVEGGQANLCVPMEV